MNSIGERFAMMEAVLALVTILPRFQLEMAGPDPTPFPSITLRPDGGVTMRVLRRKIGRLENRWEKKSEASERARICRMSGREL